MAARVTARVPILVGVLPEKLRGWPPHARRERECHGLDATGARIDDQCIVCVLPAALTAERVRNGGLAAALLTTETENAAVVKNRARVQDFEAAVLEDERQDVLVIKVGRRPSIDALRQQRLDGTTAATESERRYTLEDDPVPHLTGVERPDAAARAGPL